MTMVSLNRTRRRPPPAGSSLATDALDRAVRSSSTTRVTAKTALNSGSSQHGKARRASAGSNWVTAMAMLRPVVVGEGAAVEAVQLVVEDAGKAQVEPVAGAGGELLVEGEVARWAASSSSTRPSSRRPVRRLQAGRLDLQLDGVADQGVDRLDAPRGSPPPRRRSVTRPGRASTPAGSAAAGRCGAAGNPPCRSLLPPPGGSSVASP